jgi:GNAT superfamily N-acetyltransferase
MSTSEQTLVPGGEEPSTPSVRRHLRPSDPQAIIDLHDRVYVPEHGRNEAFVAAVGQAVHEAVAAGWPVRGGGVWLIDAPEEGRISGCLAWTRESPEVGHVRWFVLEARLRGHGLGRRWLQELLEEARASGMRRLELTTFSALRAAGHLYRSVGFEVRSAAERDDWGSPIVYQHYALEL